MQHLVPGFLNRHRPVRAALRRHGLRDVLRGLRGRELAVATRPIRAPQTRMGKPHESARHHDYKRERGSE